MVLGSLEAVWGLGKCRICEAQRVAGCWMSWVAWMEFLGGGELYAVIWQSWNLGILESWDDGRLGGSCVIL